MVLPVGRAVGCLGGTLGYVGDMDKAAFHWPGAQRKEAATIGSYPVRDVLCRPSGFK